MKKLMTLLAALSLSFSINFVTHADMNGNATKAGPLVNCKKGDGKTTYVPTMICKKNGGTFDSNWGYQF